MKPTSIIAIFTFGTLASAGCYGSGETWGSGNNVAKAKTYKDQVCSGNLGGYTFIKGETRTACYSLGEGRRVDFRMSYTGSDAKRHMSAADCKKHLGSFIDSCARGGNGESGPWSFKYVIKREHASLIWNYQLSLRFSLIV